MEKILPCRFLKTLLTLVLLVTFVTSSFAQIPPNCGGINNIPVNLCAGDNTLFTSNTTNADGLTVRWSFTDNSGGATFPAGNMSVVSGGHASIPVHLGDAGTLTVRMVFLVNGQELPTGSCSASNTVRKVLVTVNPITPPICNQDKVSITAVAKTAFTPGGSGISSPPYLYTLLPENISNTTGTFDNVDPKVDHKITAREFFDGGCTAETGNIHVDVPPVVQIHASCPIPESHKACDYKDLTQAQVNELVGAWVAKFGYTGGIPPVSKTVTLDPISGIVDKCGGTLKATIKVIDVCGQVDECSSTFTITPPEPVVAIAPPPATVPFCAADPNTIGQAFAEWLKGFKIVSGGCKPELIPVPHGEPQACGGDGIKVTFIVRDICRVDTEISSTFTFERPKAPSIDARPDLILPPCISQAELDNAWNGFLGSVKARTECGEIPVTHGSPIKPDRCLGGDVPVTFVANPNCFPPLVVTAHFIVGKATEPKIDACPPGGDLGCNPVTIPAPGTPQVSSLCPYKTEVLPDKVEENGCDRKLTRTYKVSTECFPNGVLCDQIFTYRIDTGIKDLKCAEGKDLGCNPDLTKDLPAPINPTYTASCPAKVTVKDGTPVITGCSAEMIRTYNVATDCFPLGVDCTQKFTWKVDLVKPEITKTGTCPTEVKCNPTAQEIDAMLGGATAKDNCDGDLTAKLDVKTTDKVNTKDCYWSQTRTWNVKDECGNPADQVSCTVTWKEDTTGPVITGTQDDVIIGGDEENGLCSPTTTVGGKAIPDPKYNGSTKTSIDFSQPRLGDAPTEVLDWTNGTTSGSADKYFEGMGVPQRVLITGLKPGKHTLVVSAKAVKKQDDSRHGYDFFMSWDQAIATAANIGNGTRNELVNLNKQECDGHWSGAGEETCKSLTVSKKAALPPTQGNPPNQTGKLNVDDAIKCFEAQYGERTIEMETPPGTTINSLTTNFLGYTGREEGDNFAIYEFTWESNSSVVEFKFAGHLALGGGECGYGNCHGAGDIKGNPYHIRLDAIDRAGLGSRDNQVKCERSQTCDVNIPVKFNTPKATDCDPVAPIVEKDGPEIITPSPDGLSVLHTQNWKVKDACDNYSYATSTIKVVCSLGANFGDARGTIKVAAPVFGKMANPTNTTGSLSGFKAVPNPFRTDFSLDVNSTSVEPMKVDVYDMLGKPIDQRSMSTEDSSSTRFGEGYPSGIYNVILNQGTEVKTQRVIKQ